MARFPDLPRPFPDEVLSRELLRGEGQVADSKHSERILRGLNAVQRSQLAGLVLDLNQALRDYTRHGQNSKMVRTLAAEAPGRTRRLSQKVVHIRAELEDLQEYAARLHATLGLEYGRAAKRCLDVLEKLNRGPSVAEYFESQKAEYPAIEHPRQLGIVQLYWFFRTECRCSAGESEVRSAMVANELLPLAGRRSVNYVSQYQGDESQGSSAVRLAVSRYRPRTTY
jgi:hypothetical protein